MIVTRFLIQHALDKDKVLLFNTLSGAIDIVDESLVALLEACRSGSTTPDDEADIALLKARGYIFSSEEEEARLLESVSNLGKHIRKRIQFVLCPTYTCNLRCFYCYEPIETRQGNSLMSLEQVDAAFATIARLRSERTDVSEASLNVFGGEPLLPRNREVVRAIIRHAVDAGLHISFITNGTHVAEYSDIFEPHRNQISCQVTLDGPEVIHNERRVDAAGRGTFEQICRNVNWLLESGYATLVRINLDRRNVEHIPAFLDEVERRGWHQFPHFRGNIAPVTDRGKRGFDPEMKTPLELISRMVEVMPDLSQRLERLQFNLTSDMFRAVWPFVRLLYPDLTRRVDWGPHMHFCEATYLGYYVFGPDGFVYSCPEAVATEWSLGRYWPSLEIDQERVGQWYDRTVLAVEGCEECEYALVCGAGCPLVAARTSGTPRGKNCEIKSRLSQSLDAIRPQLIAWASDTHHGEEG